METTQASQDLTDEQLAQKLAEARIKAGPAAAAPLPVETLGSTISLLEICRIPSESSTCRGKGCRTPTPNRYLCDRCDSEIEQGNAIAAQQRRQAHLVAIGVPADYTGDNLALQRYVPATKSQRDALNAATTWAARRSLPFLFLSGPVGTGKTHLGAAALVRRLDLLARLDTSVASAFFITFDDLVRKLQATFKSDTVSEDAMLSRYIDADLLMLDDIGVKTPTSYATGILFALIDGRYASRRPTIITTNKTLQELGSAIATRDEAVQAERILSRLVDREMTVGIAVDGPDHRRSRT